MSFKGYQGKLISNLLMKSFTCNEFVDIKVIKMFLNPHFKNPKPNTTEYKHIRENVSTKGIHRPIIVSYNHKNKIAIVTQGNKELHVATTLNITKVPVSIIFDDNLKEGFGVRGYIKELKLLPKIVKPNEIGLKNSFLVRKHYTKINAKRVIKTELESHYNHNEFTKKSMNDRFEKFLKLHKMQPGDEFEKEKKLTKLIGMDPKFINS